MVQILIYTIMVINMPAIAKQQREREREREHFIIENKNCKNKQINMTHYENKVSNELTVP